VTLLDWLRSRGGWAHRRDATDAGWSAYSIRLAVVAGTVAVTARSWLHVPGIAADLQTAMSLGARLTCVSALERWGLWVPHRDGRLPRTGTTLHLAVHPHSGRSASRVLLHRNVGPVAAVERSLLDPLENVLARTASCLPREGARAVWDSAVRRGVTTAGHLRAVAWTTTRARELAATVSALSDSGLESIVRERLARLGIHCRQQVRIDGHPVDLVIGRRLIIQLDGLEYHQAADRRRDIAHDRRLRLAGYTVFRFDYLEIHEEWPRVEADILRALAQRLHLA